jgi:hypothetical protein
MTNTIRVLGLAESKLKTKSIFGEREPLEIGAVQPELLKSKLKDLTDSLEDVFTAIETGGGFRLKEVTIGVEISSSGAVTLIGSLQAGAKAAATLTFGFRE